MAAHSRSTSRISSCSAPDGVDRASRRIVLAANTSWYITNFRGGLVRALRDAGFFPVVVAPFDSGNDAQLTELGLELQPVAMDRSGINPVTDLLLLRRLREILRLYREQVRRPDRCR